MPLSEAQGEHRLGGGQEADSSLSLSAMAGSSRVSRVGCFALSARSCRNTASLATAAMVMSP